MFGKVLKTVKIRDFGLEIQWLRRITARDRDYENHKRKDNGGL